MDNDSQKKPPRSTVWMPLLFALTLVGGMFIGMQMKGGGASLQVDQSLDLLERVAGQGKVEELIRYIEAKYVEEVDREQLVDEAINSLLQQLDPHSSYIPAEQLKQINAELEGNFDGIGVEFMILDDTIVVVSALSGGPSEAVGIRAGDKIVMVEDSTIAGQGLRSEDIVGLLRGEKGTVVNIGVVRGKEPELRRFSITRDKIPLHSVDVAYMVDKSTGYVKINRFSANTYEEFMGAIERLVEQEDMRNLILDLRHNPGGYLQQATKLLSQLFRQKGKLLVYTEGASVPRSEYQSNGRALFNLGEIAILIDEGSASASEIVAGAIQDHDRGIIVGRRSFGKGLVQEQYRLRDGSALRLTVARYFTPSGRSIQKPYDDLEGYRNDMLARFESGELIDGHPDAQMDSTEFYTDKGRVVYGGGGITPDIFVPVDSLLFRDDYVQLRQELPAFAYRYLEEERPALEAYTLDAFVDEYEVPSAVFYRFLQDARDKGIETQGPIDRHVRAELKRFLKARVAQLLFGEEGFYRSWHQEDLFLQEALEGLRSKMSITSN